MASNRTGLDSQSLSSRHFISDLPFQDLTPPSVLIAGPQSSTAYLCFGQHLGHLKSAASKNSTKLPPNLVSIARHSV